MNKDITKFDRENWCKRKQTQSKSAMNSQSSINWVKLLQSLAKNCCKVWRKCCRNQPRKVRPEMLQKSAEKRSAGKWAKIGRKMGKNRPRKVGPRKVQKSAEKSSAAKGRPQKVGRKRLAAKLLQIRPGHSCDQFLPAMNSQSSINRV